MNNQYRCLCNGLSKEKNEDGKGQSVLIKDNSLCVFIFYDNGTHDKQMFCVSLYHCYCENSFLLGFLRMKDSLI